MSDPALVVACSAVVIAISAASMAWCALENSRITRKSHDQLFQDFWKQSIEQAKENGHQWGFQLRQAEWLRDLFVSHTASRRPKSPQQPPN